jgi:hypothetical protein
MKRGAKVGADGQEPVSGAEGVGERGWLVIALDERAPQGGFRFTAIVKVDAGRTRPLLERRGHRWSRLR